MKDLIIKLLKENGRLILPDFGAFIVKTKSPFTVIFNEFLQYNDGALISASEEQFKIDRDSAAEKVKEYVKEIVTKLSNGESFDLSEIGVLSKNATGKIALNVVDSNVPKEASGTIEKPSTTVEFDINETETKKPVADKKEAKPEIKKPEIKKETPTPPGSKPINKPIEQKKTIPSPPVAKPIEKPVEKKMGEQPKEPMPISKYYDDNTSKNRLNVILWIVLIVLINGAIVGYFVFDDEIKGFLGKDKSPMEEQLIETPEIEDEIIPITDETTPVINTPTETTDNELVIEDIHDETVETEQNSPMLTGKRYYVVAGVFKVESNADNLVKTLRQKGYNAEKFGKIGTLFAVSYEVFPTKPEADKFMLKIKREIDSEAWIRVVN